MQINLKIVGKSLFNSLSQAVSNSLFPKNYQGEKIVWQLSLVQPNFDLDALLAQVDEPSVFLLEAADHKVLTSIAEMELQTNASLQVNTVTLPMFAPIVLVFSAANRLPDNFDFPALVSDWVVKPVVFADLACRLFTALKKKKMLQSSMHFGPISLTPVLRMMTFERKTIKLTPSELILAEFFFSQMGTIVSAQALSLFFESKAKSTQANNIRVAVFQLRLKVEGLTGGRVTLVNIYKKGYCLRVKGVKAEEPDETVQLTESDERLVANA